MRIAIDAHRLVTEPFSSGAIYLSTFLRGVREMSARGHTLLLYIPCDFADQNPHRWVAEVPEFRLRKPRHPCSPSHSFKQQVFWNQVVIAAMAWRDRPDMLFMPFHLTPICAPGKVVTAIHDVCFLSHPSTFSPLGQTVHTCELWTALLRAKKLITISEFTHSWFGRFYPRRKDRMTVVYTGITAPPVDRAGTTTPFFIWIGRRDMRKRPELVFQAFQQYLARAESDIREMVIVVPQNEVADFNARVTEKYGLGDKVRILSGLSENYKFALLREAAALLFPSEAEGFGLPVLEAMIAGCIPLLHVDGPASDVVPACVPRMRSFHADELASLMHWAGAIRRESKQQIMSELQERARKFTPTAMAAKMLSIFEQTAN